MSAKILKFTIIGRAIFQVPVNQTTHRGSSWLAIIGAEPTLPGGLSRQFMNRGKGEFLYIVEQIGIHDAVEFGADHSSAYGRKTRNRWYGVVTSKTETEMTIEECATGLKAVLRSAELRSLGAA